MDNTNTRPAVASITDAEIEDGKMMGILAYIIFLVPLLAARDKKYAMFHTEQALVLLIAWIVLIIAFNIIAIIVSASNVHFITCGVWLVSLLVYLAGAVLWILGIINAATGKVKELPFIGQYGAKLNLVK